MRLPILISPVKHSVLAIILIITPSVIKTSVSVLMSGRPTYFSAHSVQLYVLFVCVLFCAFCAALQNLPLGFAVTIRPCDLSFQSPNRKSCLSSALYVVLPTHIAGRLCGVPSLLFIRIVYTIRMTCYVHVTCPRRRKRRKLAFMRIWSGGEH